MNSATCPAICAKRSKGGPPWVPCGVCNDWKTLGAAAAKNPCIGLMLHACSCKPSQIVQAIALQSIG